MSRSGLDLLLVQIWTSVLIGVKVKDITNIAKSRRIWLHVCRNGYFWSLWFMWFNVVFYCYHTLKFHMLCPFLLQLWQHKKYPWTSRFDVYGKKECLDQGSGTFSKSSVYPSVYIRLITYASCKFRHI